METFERMDFEIVKKTLVNIAIHKIEGLCIVQNVAQGIL